MALVALELALEALQVAFGGLGGSRVGFQWPWWHLSWALVALVALELALVALQVAFGGLGGS